MISVFYCIDGFYTSNLEHVKLNRLGFYIIQSGFGTKKIYESTERVKRYDNSCLTLRGQKEKEKEKQKENKKTTTKRKSLKTNDREKSKHRKMIVT
jgi:hypothetical protein